MHLPHAFLLVVGPVLLAGCGGDASSDINGPPPGAPTAYFTIHCDLLQCTFRNRSVDLDGSIRAYQWDFGDNSVARTTRDAAHRYAAPGEFMVTLTVTDDDGKAGVATERVIVGDPPTAAFAADCATLVCNFKDESSTPRGSLVAWLWNLGDGQTSRDQNPHHVYQLVGPTQVEVTLTVTDEDGETATATRQVTVGRPPQAPPIAAFSVTCSGLVCTFTDQSTSPTDVLNIWDWDFGDGHRSEDHYRNPIHVYDVTVTTRFTVTLMVCDSNVNCDSASQEILVTPDD